VVTFYQQSKNTAFVKPCKYFLKHKILFFLCPLAHGYDIIFYRYSSFPAFLGIFRTEELFEEKQAFFI
jgi:hypothetical protein